MLLFALVCAWVTKKKNAGRIEGKRREAFERAIFILENVLNAVEGLFCLDLLFI
jgi:hypothetical protein